MRLHSSTDNANHNSKKNTHQSFLDAAGKESFLSGVSKGESPFIPPRVQHKQLQGNDSETPRNEDNIITSKNQENDIVGDSGTSDPLGPLSQPATPSQVFSSAVATIGNVSSSTSPAGMPDRIPPRVDTNVAVKVSGFSIPMANIEFSIEGANATNGNATINGAATHVQNNNAILSLRGTTQTAPGSAGKLRVVAKQGATVIATSNYFSVSSIPQNFSVSLDTIINSGPNRGIKVNNNWESDSGNVADLDEAERSESVATTSKSGVFSGVAMTNKNSGYNSGNNPPRQDSHAIGPAATLKGLAGNGSLVFDQLFLFWDKRTGVKDLAVNNSGFKIIQDLAYDAATAKTTLTTTKKGANASANGHTSKAGTGTASNPQVL